MMLGRPVKFCADRLESFVSDAQARDHRLKCRIAVKKSGEILAMEMDDIGAVGAYGMPLRFNVAEGMMAITVDRRAVQLRQLQGPHAQRLRQQEPDRHVSRRRHAARLHRHRTADRPRGRQARHRHRRVQAPHLSAEVVAALRDAGRPAARNRLVPRMPGQARRA